jgi:hypothetical protein
MAWVLILGLASLACLSTWSNVWTLRDANEQIAAARQKIEAAQGRGDMVLVRYCDVEFVDGEDRQCLVLHPLRPGVPSMLCELSPAGYRRVIERRPGDEVTLYLNDEEPPCGWPS